MWNFCQTFKYIYFEKIFDNSAICFSIFKLLELLLVLPEMANIFFVDVIYDYLLFFYGIKIAILNHNCDVKWLFCLLLII